MPFSGTGSTDAVTELRREIGGLGRYHYVVATRAKLHPSRLSAILHGRIPLTPEVEARIRAAIRTLARSA